MTHDAVGGVERILVPLDGSDGSAQALDHAITLASELGASIHLVAVVDPYGLSSVTERQEVETELEDVVASGAARVQETGIPVTTAVEAGFPHREILGSVEARSIDLIVMGTHGRRGLDRFVLGSVAEKVVRLSPVPVLTVRIGASGERPYRDVVIPTDGSDAAMPAERLGVDLARQFGATVHALSVVPQGRIRSSETDAAFEEAAQAAVERVETRAATRAGDDGEVLATIERGVPHRRILDYCGDVDADLVVLGTHGRTGVERFVLGSVAEKVLRLSETPVLVVPSKRS
jgi:nucleotide-binding universal stress UspA family protein